ncbi:MAG: NADH-quinone oxidoreductase subunit NuoK [Cupriavidus sp.]|nr:NADH-quinone oxidoreductase subunit NuoK [Cupriavidus pauculus]MBU68291.1 NADH-quinone oxidoreductase subunit NuoK [Cupriavidus sp.]
MPRQPPTRTKPGEPAVLSLAHFLVLGAILFAISIVGIFLNRKNVIVLLMALELMLLAVNMNFVAFSHYMGDLAGQVFVFFILTVAAAESAIGLAILVVLFRNLDTINVDDMDTLKG